MAILEDWAPDACTLPTPERPLRVAEFDEFVAAVLQSTRPQPRVDLVVLDALEARAVSSTAPTLRFLTKSPDSHQKP
jgi:hypothetical protein